MPKLSKIRLTGCKYEGMKKEHENSIFDLTKGGQPDHTLFTLFNGGGKGVMMQLIFQILLPETKWGKNHGNKVISMFYDQRNNLHPFTFHVVLEWVLDAVPERRLITGIAVKAIIKNTSGEEEEKTGLSYFLYTHEHENKGYFSVENLPLVDQQTGKAVDIEKLEAFIDERKRDFIKYSQASGRKTDSQYYKYLANRGIYRSEWINLKSINKLEGGAGDYFIGASDNKAIFDKKIIPVISENIKNYTHDEGDHLIEMFRSNLSITKDLPVLMKREGGYKDLLVEIRPLIENADSGSRFIDMKERLIDEGNDIYFILSEEQSRVLHEIHKWDQSEKKGKEEGINLEFKKNNLYYNKEKRDLDAVEKEALEAEEQFNEKSHELEDKEKELLLYQINEKVFHKKETEEKIKSKVEEKERLVAALDITDLKQRADELDDEIEMEWDKTKNDCSNHENQYLGFKNYIKQLVEENARKKKVYQSKVEELQNKINKFVLKEEALEKYKEKLGQYYDFMRLAFPDRILDDLNKENTEITSCINRLSDGIKNHQEKLATFNNDLVKLKYSLEMKDGRVKELKSKIDLQQRHELEIARKVSKRLFVSYEGGLLNHDWFAKKQRDLKVLELNKKQSLEETQRTIWEKNIDKSLNKEDYFIPNKDVILIKDEIKKLNIHVETGPEYLSALNQEEKMKVANETPGILYSVIIASQRDWEIIEKNINRNLFMNNMVPIYVRSQMKSNENRLFKMVAGLADGLVEESKYLNWKKSMEQEMENLSSIENNLKKDLEDIGEILQELNIIEKNDTAWTLNQNLKEEEASIADLVNVIGSKEEERTITEGKLKQLNGEYVENESKLEGLKNSIKEIEVYIEKIQEVNQDRLEITSVKRELLDIKQLISDIDMANEEIKEKLDTITGRYNEWNVSIKNLFNRVKSVYPEATYNTLIDQTYSNHRPPSFFLEEDKLLALVTERKIVDEDIAHKDSQIATIDVDLKYLNKDLGRFIDELEKLDSNWANFPYLNLPLIEIEMIIKIIDKKIKQLENEKTTLKSIVDTAKGSIKSSRKTLENKEEQIMKNHNKAPILLEIEIEDIKSEINNVERDIESNKKYLKLCDDELLKHNQMKTKIVINLSRIKTGYPLEPNKGKREQFLAAKVKESPDTVVEEWLRKCDSNKRKMEATILEGERYKSKFIKVITSKLEEDKLKEKIVNTIKEANIDKFKSNLTSFNSMEKHFQEELLRLSKDKKKAEDVMKQWTHRASLHIIRMIEALKSMVASMNYVNEQGYAFPLVKLKGAEGLPKEVSEIEYLLEEYFIESISKVLEKNEEISSIDDRTLRDIMGDKTIFSKGLKGRYPTLMVYKMSEKNEFRYARAREEYYTTWEAINKGEGDLPEGSGGQTLSVNTFVIMMLMSFKKKTVGNENPSTVLILDNPFGKASAKHVLDPIFEIARKLNFQLICFAAPEIIKVEISERFPVFWELKVQDGKIVHGGRVIK
ncbi:coiled-coil domain-containing protein [Alkaliphilus hydrothermalis]|uniref:Chromosome segregation ATPase n=1 Tax=Alkaliphilus hydrothermalis TaxID=1482730 RepID=A0ABS2NM61_9FIRM|nr:hypothetical protein [Alkaliphilus hydrothermalis]MBM7614033.1 hypothetical protein [Alkaliphilus hydrothermalis]